MKDINFENLLALLRSDFDGEVEFDGSILIYDGYIALPPQEAFCSYDGKINLKQKLGSRSYEIRGEKSFFVEVNTIRGIEVNHEREEIYLYEEKNRTISISNPRYIRY